MVNPDVETISGDWSANWGAERGFFGKVTLDDVAELKFPMLHGYDDIPIGTTVLWGVTHDLKHCTVTTLPYGPHGSKSADSLRTFFAQSPIVHLLTGREHVADPVGLCVHEIMFTPEPNARLHALDLTQLIEPRRDLVDIQFSAECSAQKKGFANAEYAYFVRVPEAIFETRIEGLGMTVSARMLGHVAPDEENSTSSKIAFRLCFDSPLSIDGSLDQVLCLCALLAYLSHSYVTPTEFYVWLGPSRASYSLFSRNIPSRRLSDRGWARHTLALPDLEPERFSSLLQRWYAKVDTRLGARFLYRASLEDPHTYSTERFLSVFKAVEGIVPTDNYRFLTTQEMQLAEDALKATLADSPKLRALLGKLRSNNTSSLKYIFSQELPKFLADNNIDSHFDVSAFVERIYRRRTKSSHGGSSGDDLGDKLIDDTLLLMGIFVLLEAADLELNIDGTLAKISEALAFHTLPLTTKGKPFVRTFAARIPSDVAEKTTPARN